MFDIRQGMILKGKKKTGKKCNLLPEGCVNLPEGEAKGLTGILGLERRDDKCCPSVLIKLYVDVCRDDDEKKGLD